MQLTPHDLLKIAHLARLGMKEEEAQRFADQLSGLFNHAQRLNEVNTEGVEPIAQITGLQDVFFEDKAQVWEKTDELLQQSPQPVRENMIRVPKTI